MNRWLALAAVIASAAGCWGPRAGEPCREDGTCSSGLVCITGICRDLMGFDGGDVAIDRPIADVSDASDVAETAVDASDANDVGADALDAIDVDDATDVAMDTPIGDAGPDVVTVDGAMCPGPGADAGTCGSHASIGITLGDTVCGVASGASSIATSSCQPLTGGPESAFTFTVMTATGVSLTTRSGFDSVLTVRRTCDNASDEVACNDVQSGGASSSLRAVLQPGTYFAVVDEFGAGGTGGSFVLETGTYMPARNALCADAETLRGMMSVSGEAIGTGDSTSTVCRTIDHGAERFYTVPVMAGQTLAALATPTGGWRVAVHLFDGCTAAANCLADGAGTTAMPNPTVSWRNGGTTTRDVIIAVAAVDDPVPAGAQYSLMVTLTP